MSLSVLLGFAGLCVVLTLMPGPDTFLVMRYSLQGARPGIAAAAGSALGSLVWAGAVAAGLAAVLEQSATSYRIVRIVGGLYLLYLGISALIRRGTTPPVGTGTPANPVPAHRALRAGVLSCILNPKVGLFFLAVAPQFLPTPHASFSAVMTLGLIDATIALTYLLLLAVVSARLVLWLRRPHITRTLDRLSATILAAFGIGTLATTT